MKKMRRVIGCTLAMLVVSAMCMAPGFALGSDAVDPAKSEAPVVLSEPGTGSGDDAVVPGVGVEPGESGESGESGEPGESGESGAGEEGEEPIEPKTSQVLYRTHVQLIGWQDYVKDGEMAGTSGQSLRLEAMEMKLADAEGSIQYRTHVQNVGWLDWVQDGAGSGTSGQAKRLEAVRIRLSGPIAEEYDVYYQVHAQNLGWLGWAKNGERAGTAGYAYRLEGIRVKLVKKGNPAPGSTARPYVQRFVTYSAYVQGSGWQNWKFDGEMAGTQGQSKRLEGLAVKLSNPEYAGGIEYRSHVQNTGWESGWKANGAWSGAAGKGLRLEAVQLRLTGAMAVHYDVYYRLHVQNYGWLDWAKNGECAGSEGLALRVEGIEIRLVPKGQAAPGSTAKAFVRPGNVNYAAYSPSTGWQSPARNGATLGNAGSGQRLEAFRISLGENDASGGIQYAAHIQNVGWTGYVADGEVCGTTNSGQRMEAIRVRLTGDMAANYDVLYRVYVQNIGWLDWTSNGRDAGTGGGSFRVEAMQVKVLPKNGNPAQSARAFFNFVADGGFLVAQDANGNKLYNSTSLFGAKRTRLLKVNLTTKKVDALVPDGNGNNRITLNRFLVSTGKPSTPTRRGDFVINSHIYYFNTAPNARCFYFTPFDGGIGFHTVLYARDPSPQRVIDGRLGMELSHGCIRMAVNDAKWIYDNCANGTRVSVR